MPTGQQIVDQARQAAAANSAYQFGGNPYLGATWAQFRSDCSGLIDRIFANLGSPLPGRPTTTDLVKMGSPVNGLANAQPGDLLFFNNNSHVGIYVGNGQMIDDPTTGQTVKQEAVYATPNAIRRVSTGTSSPAPGSVLAAIEAATSNADTRLAMALGAMLEGGSLGAGPFPTGDNGQSPGPFQIRLYDNTGAPVHGNQITRAQAQDPTSAVHFMLAEYQAAVDKVGHAAFLANPQRAAEQAAFLAERPAQDYYTARGTGAVDNAYKAASGALSGAPAGTATNAGFTIPNPLDPLNVWGGAGGVTGAVTSGVETVLKDIAKPVTHFLENSFLVTMGVVAVIIGILLLAGGGGGGGGGGDRPPVEEEAAAA